MVIVIIATSELEIKYDDLVPSSQPIDIGLQMAMPLNLNLLKLVLICKAAFAVELADSIVVDTGEGDVVGVEQNEVRSDYIHRLDVCVVRVYATL